MIKIGKNDVFLILKRNPNRFFTAEQIKDSLGINVQSAYSALNKLAKAGDIKSKSIDPLQGPSRKLFSYISIDTDFVDIVTEYSRKREDYGYLNSDTISTLMLIKEIRSLKEEMKK